MLFNAMYHLYKNQIIGDYRFIINEQLDLGKKL